MTYLLVQYGVPADVNAFNRYYHETHVPLAKALPGLREFTVSDGLVNPLAGTAPHLIAQLTFDSPEAVEAALASPEGQATVADLPNFVTGGVSIMVYTARLA